MMRVGYLTYGLDRAPTGIGRYAVELLEALSALPDAPELVLLTTEKSDPLGLWDRFEHYPIQGCRLLPALLTAGNLLLSRAAHKYSLDIIHDPNGIAPFLGPRNGQKWVVTIHDAFAYVFPETHNRLDNWRYRWLLPRAAQRSNAVLTVSECSRRDLVRYLNLNPDRVMVTPEGVNPIFQPVDNPALRETTLNRYGIKAPYLLYLGGLNARKNITGLLEAYKEVRKQFPDVDLVLGGKRQWQAAGIDNAIQQDEFAGHVHVTGYVAETDLPVLYSAAEAFVFPSLYEGFGLPPLEAMACGTPVVTSTAGSLPEVVGEAGLPVNPYDVRALAAAIVQVLSDETLRTRMRERGYQRVSQYQWDRTARETMLAYWQALAAY